MNPFKCYQVVFFLLFLTAEIGQAQTFISYEALMNDGYRSGKNETGFNYDLVKSFLKDLHPKLYLLNGKTKDLSQGHISSAEVDVRSLQQLLTMDNTALLEMLTIKISVNDVSKIDLTQLGKFKNLKYIHIICDFKCNEDYIKRLFLNNRTDYLIIYSISIPS